MIGACMQDEKALFADSHVPKSPQKAQPLIAAHDTQSVKTEQSTNDASGSEAGPESPSLGSVGVGSGKGTGAPVSVVGCGWGSSPPPQRSNAHAEHVPELGPSDVPPTQTPSHHPQPDPAEVQAPQEDI